MKKIFFILLAALIYNTTPAQDSAIAERYPVIPYPTHLQPLEGAFTINKTTTLYTEKPFTNESAYLQTLIRNATGFTLKISNGHPGNNAIILATDNKITADEGYQLNIHPGKIILSAKTATGIFRGIETIRQLLPVNEKKSLATHSVMLPAAEIEDAPLYSWRGMHLDVARHFFSINYLKKFIDVMALYKMNKLHLHLTDDQGWRIEIKKYPKLTEEGAWRNRRARDGRSDRHRSEVGASGNPFPPSVRSKGC